MYLGRLSMPAYVDITGTSATVTITASEDWIVDLTTIGLDVSDTKAVCRVYQGGASPENLIGQSLVAYGDVDDTAKLFLAGEQITAVWTGVTTAKRAFLRVVGLKYQPGYGAIVWAGRGAK